MSEIHTEVRKCRGSPLLGHLEATTLSDTETRLWTELCEMRRARPAESWVGLDDLRERTGLSSEHIWGAVRELEFVWFETGGRYSRALTVLGVRNPEKCSDPLSAWEAIAITVAYEERPS